MWWLNWPSLICCGQKCRRTCVVSVHLNNIMLMYMDALIGNLQVCYRYTCVTYSGELLIYIILYFTFIVCSVYKHLGTCQQHSSNVVVMSVILFVKPVRPMKNVFWNCTYWKGGMIKKKQIAKNINKKWTFEFTKD